MKKFITTLLICCQLNGFAAITPVKKTTGKYEPFQEQTVVLPTPFAKPFIVDKSDIDLLAGKTIHHIDLVYTAYRSSPDFNQEGLNKQRIAELKKLLPQINADNPTWAAVEQTGAKDRETANTYFHGFVIHYTDKQDPHELRAFFSDKAKSMTDYTVSPEKGGTFNYPSGTKITIPANAVTYADGSPLKGNYELHYREFRNSAEIALSGIPMTYNQKGTEYNFSSVGMYELRGTQNDKELKLQKPITVDFNCTEVVDDAAFYQLDDKNGEWKKIEPVVFGNNQPEAIPQNDDVPDNSVRTKFEHERVVREADVQQLDIAGTGSISTMQGNKKPATLESPDGLFLQYTAVGNDLAIKMNPGAWKNFRQYQKTQSIC